MAGTTTLLSHAVGSTNTGGTGMSVDTDMTPDGVTVTFQSAFPGGTDNLVSNDTNGQTQLFVTGTDSVGTTAAPTIQSEQVLVARKLNKKHKPVGKPVFIGFEFQFSEAMNPATAGNYEVDWLSTKRVKRKTVQIFHPLAVHAQYNAATNSVSLLLSNQQKFAKGGRITVIATPPGGVSSVAGDDGVFTIPANARGITRGQARPGGRPLDKPRSRRALLAHAGDRESTLCGDYSPARYMRRRHRGRWVKARDGGCLKAPSSHGDTLSSGANRVRRY